MICPLCKARDLKSTVHPGVTFSTLIAFSSGYYDEEGQWVGCRDPNSRTTNYLCSRSHCFAITRREGEPDVITLQTETYLSFSGVVPRAGDGQP